METTRIARYTGGRYEVHFNGEVYVSDDGDWWCRCDGKQVPPEFDDIIIRLEGGPRDGETVA